MTQRTQATKGALCLGKCIEKLCYRCFPQNTIHVNVMITSSSPDMFAFRKSHPDIVEFTKCGLLLPESPRSALESEIEHNENPAQRSQVFERERSSLRHVVNPQSHERFKSRPLIFTPF
jgi:hypothetical protein